MNSTTPSHPRRLGELDALRCLAMSAVIAQHSTILPFGWMGVWLFYVISGFVVTNSLMTQGQGLRFGVRLRDFYVRRCARILPIYLLYATVGFVVSGLLSHGFEWLKLASFLLFFNNYLAPFGDGFYDNWPIGHLWTISAEMQFYLLFAPLFLLASRRRVTLVLLVIVGLSPAARILAGMLLSRYETDTGRIAYQIYSASFLHFDAFGLGALLAIHRTWATSPRRSRVLLGLGLGAMALYASVYVSLSLWGHHRTGLSAFKNIISGIAYGDYHEGFLYSAVDLLAVGVLAAAISGAGRWTAALRLAPLQWIGRISYGGYVYHLLALAAVEAVLQFLAVPLGLAQLGRFRGVLLFLGVYPTVLVLAQLSYTRLEAPLIALGGRWIHRRAVVPAVESPLPAESGSAL
jgi:peptidoglycan/LPS O-acetylase OafA/YrhL